MMQKINNVAVSNPTHHSKVPLSLPNKEGMPAMSDIKRKSIFADKWPVCEIAFIPLTAATGSLGLAAAITRIVALLSGLQLGIVPYICLFFTVLIAAWATIVRIVLNLPYMLRLVDLLAAGGVTLLCMRLQGSITPGIILYSETPHLVQADQLMLLTCIVAWTFTGLLASIIQYIIPWKWLVTYNPDFAKRLDEEQYQRLVYQRKNASLATGNAWRTAYRFMSILFAVTFIAAVFGHGAPIAEDLTLSLSGLLAMFGLLIYMALVQLSARNRLLELGKWVNVSSKYGVVWVQAALIPVIIAIVLSVMIPANISPLTRVDGTRIGNWLGMLLYQSLRGGVFRFAYSGSSPQNHYIPPGGSAGSSMSGLVVLFTYGVAIALLILCLRSLWLLLKGERERAREMWRLLFAILTFPLRIIVMMILGLFMRIKH